MLEIILSTGEVIAKTANETSTLNTEKLFTMPAIVIAGGLALYSTFAGISALFATIETIGDYKKNKKNMCPENINYKKRWIKHWKEDYHGRSFED